MMEKEYYLAIPYDLLSDNALNLTEKSVIAEIMSLYRIKGQCYASNAYFSKRLGLSERTISTVLNRLKDKGYLTLCTEKNYKRIINVIDEKIRGYFFFTSSDKNAKSSKGVEKSSDQNAKSSSLTANSSTYNNNYNNNKNNIYNYKKHKNSFFDNEEYIRPKTSYDLEELMRIK